MAEKSLRFARNFSWSLAGQLATAFLNFLVVPYVIHHLGVETYGIYILMYATSSYLQLCALGAGPTTTRYVAWLSAAGSRLGLRRLLKYSAVFHAAGVCCGAAACFGAASFIAARVFRIPGPLLDLAVFVVRCAAAGAFFAALTQMGLCVLQGFQRFRSFSFVSFLQSGLMPLGTAGLIMAGRGLRAIALWYVLLNAVLAVLTLALARARYEDFAGLENGASIDLRAFTAWSLSSWLGPLAWIISNQFDKLFLAHALSLTAVTLYSVPAGLLQRLQTFPSAVSAVVSPMMSEISQPNEDLRRMYLKSYRFLLWLLLPGLVLLFVFMPQFLGLWLHGDFAGPSVWPARVLVVAQVFFVSMTIPSTAAFSLDRPGYLSAVAWAQALTSLVAWRLLIPHYGLLGIAIGTLIAQAAPAVVYVLVINRLVGLSLRRYVVEALGGPALSAVAALAAVFPFHELASSWPRLAGFGVLGAGVFYACAWALMRREDRELAGLFARRALARFA